MSSIVGVSFVCMILGALSGLEWSGVGTFGLVFAAVAATVFFSAIDAWEGEEENQDAIDAPIAVRVPAKAPIARR
jgi:hypothetical protein